MFTRRFRLCKKYDLHFRRITDSVVLGNLGGEGSDNIVQCEQLQHMIALLEREARQSGFDYSADFLKIAASSLHREAVLSCEASLLSKTPLEKMTTLQ